jgi:hypothetical protein
MTITMHSIPGTGDLMCDGHDIRRADVLAAAHEHLIDSGALSEVQAEDVLVDHRGRIARAWWGGDALGFVGETHPDAQPVTVVHVNLDGEPR